MNPPVVLTLALCTALGPGAPAWAAAPLDAEALYAPEPGAGPVEDPIEPVNRALFGLDTTINRLLAGKGRILAMAKWIPAPARAGLYNAFDNLQEPSTFANDLLQKKPRRAVQTAGRFAVNSTVGALGVFDVASRLKLKRTREDFGQTLATWGITPGPYVYVPLSGPTTTRDAVAGLVDGVFVPGHWFPMNDWARRAMRVVKYGVQPSTIGIRQVARGAAETGETKDEYATLRQLYYDQRAAQIADRPNLADDPVASFPESKPKKQKKPRPAKGADKTG